MDKLKIISNEIFLNPERFGIPFDTYFWTDGTEAKKYRIFKDNSNEGNFLQLTLTSRGRGFTIENSLRAWWFGNTMQDFDYYSFCKCIKKLAKRLGIKKSELWNSGVTYLEIGGNIRLHRDYASIIPSMVAFPRLKRIPYSETTTYFKATNWQIIAYDKVAEMYNHKKISRRVWEKLSETIFFLRFEVKLTTPSGTTIGDKVNTLYKIRDNWDFLIDYWEKTFCKIKYLRYHNPKPLFKNEHMTRKELKDYGFAVAVKEQGLEHFHKIIDTRFRMNHKSQEKSNIAEICRRCSIEDFSEFQKHVTNAVILKANKMRKSKEL